MPLSITYENWTHDDLDAGDTDDKGYLYDACDLWTFVRELGYVTHVERTHNGATLYCEGFTSDYTRGVETVLAGHIKGTHATVERIVRVLRARRMVA